MFKKLLCTFLAMTLMLSMAMTANASTIIESPYIKIIINGENSTYTDTPLVVNSRTMLPLREVLTNLGVQNDDDHIQWNGEDKSITIHTNTDTIVLTIGNQTAYVNNKKMTLDVAPMIYQKNNRTYIPARFVSESMGKKVAWNDEMKAVLISDTDSYNTVKDALTKTKAAMTSAHSYSCNIDYQMDVNILDTPFGIFTNYKSTVDFKNKSAFSSVFVDMSKVPGFAVKMTTDTYIVDDVSYSKSTIFNSPWEKSSLEDFEPNIPVTFTDFDVTDALACGLIVSEDSTDDTLILKGQGYTDLLIEETFGKAYTYDPNATKQDIDYVNLTLKIDKKTSTLIAINYAMALTYKDSNKKESGTFAATIDIDYSEMNSVKAITVPKEVIDEANKTN